MAIITIPAVSANGASLRLVRGDTTLEFFSGAVAVVQGTKALWMLTFPLAVQRLVDARLWQAALVQLSKPDNQFQVVPPSWFSGTGYSGSNPTVSGASQLGTSLNCSVAGSPALSLAGDFIEVNGEFKCLTQDATASGGSVTFNFEPALRVSPANGATVDVKTPKITMRLLSPEGGWNVSLPEFYNITVDAIEHYT